MPRKLLIAAAVLLVGIAAAALVARLLDADSVRAAVERQASAYLGQPVKVSAVRWSLLGGPRVVLTGVQVGSPPAVTLGRVELTTGMRGLLSRRVEHGTLTVARSRIVLPLPIVLDRNAAAGAAPAGAAGTGGFTIASIDRISLAGMDLVAGRSRVRLDLESSLAGDRLLVPRFTLRSARTEVSGRGEFSSLSARKAHFSAVADPLDLDEWLAMASAFSARSDPGAAAAAPPLDVRVDLQAARGRLLGAEFSRLKTMAALAGNTITLEPLTAAVFGGTVTGRIRVDATSEPSRGSLSAAIEGVDVSQLAAMVGHPGVLTGRLRGDVQLRADIGPGDLISRTAAGSARVVVTDGTAPGLDLVRPVILAFGRPDPGSSAEPSRAFSRLAGTFSLAADVLRSDDLVMNSRDLDLRGRGTLVVADAAVDVKADLVLSEALSAQAGRDLIRYAREGSRVVLPATITGSLAAPSVSIDTTAALGRALRNTLSDKLRKLFKR